MQEDIHLPDAHAEATLRERLDIFSKSPQKMSGVIEGRHDLLPALKQNWSQWIILR